MTAKWPNTELWQRVVQTFRLTDGPRWRTALAQNFVLEKDELRSQIDREDLDNRTIKWVNERLISVLHEYARQLQDYADAAYELAKDIRREDNGVSTVDLSELDLPEPDLEFVGPHKPGPCYHILEELLESIS